MYIRDLKKGDKIIFRLVESYRGPNGPRQRTVLTFNELNLPKEQWKELANIVEMLLSGQTFINNNTDIIDKAENIVKLIKRKTILKVENQYDKVEIVEKDIQNVDLNSLKHTEVRSIGAEHVALSVYKELEIDKVLKENGFSEHQREVAALSIIGRLVYPESEKSTREWAINKSGLDSLLNTSFSKLSNNSLYRITDKLYSLKETLESHLIEKERSLLNLKEKLVLFDLTNTYFEGNCSSIPGAKFGLSKEKRKDCRLLTLGFIIDENGFPKTCKVMEGNQSEPSSLVDMIKQLEEASNEKDRLFKDKIVVIDAGISSESNLKYLSDQGYHYICVAKNKPFSCEEINQLEASDIFSTQDKEIKATILKKEDETYLYCVSPMKKVKEQSMLESFTKKYIRDLELLKESLAKKKTVKSYDKILEKLGRLKEKHKSISRFIVVDIEQEDNLVQSISWENTYSDQKDFSYNGSYFLRTNLNNFNEQELWNIYSTLTNIEYSFRCLKSELAFRPVYHKIQVRAESHLFIAVLAYHILNVIRTKLKAHDINFSWNKTRELLSTHNLITTEMKTEDSKIITIVQPSDANEIQKRIYKALNIKINPINRKIIKLP